MNFYDSVCKRFEALPIKPDRCIVIGPESVSPNQPPETIHVKGEVSDAVVCETLLGAKMAGQVLVKRQGGLVWEPWRDVE